MLARGTARDLEGIARAIEMGQPMADEVRRVQEAWKTFQRPLVSADTWRALAAVELLERARRRLGAPDWQIARTRDERIRETTACLVASWVCGDAGGLGRITIDAWCSALSRWRGLESLKPGRPTCDATPWYRVLFDLLKSAGLAGGVTTAPNLGKQVARAIKRRKQAEG